MWCARTVKAVTAAAAAVLVAAGVRFVGPAAAGFVAEELPRAQAAAATWLTPPYLYLFINAIIISIAASSRFQLNRQSTSYTAGAVAGTEEPEPAPVPAPAVAMGMGVPVPVPEVQPPEAVAMEEPVVKTVPAPVVVEEEEEELSILRSAWTPRRMGTEAEADVENEVAPFADLTNPREKPLVSARFGKKAAKPSPEGSRALRVARPRKEETLESTWKAITEGRAQPLARHLKKSDTWETRPGRRPSGDSEDAAHAATMRKAETFNDVAGGGGGGGRKVRREPSLGQDELNRRVEAFINKFNMEMRLQRQESLKQYNDMVGRGSHY